MIDYNELYLYKLHPAVFYRCYDNTVVLYHTSQQKVYTFNESAGDIIRLFSDYYETNKVIDKLRQEYKMSRNSIKDVYEFIDELAQKGIIVKKYQQSQLLNDFEKDISFNFLEEEQLFSTTFELTYKCNEQCRHCYVTPKKKNELTFEQVIAILNELAEMKVLNIVFTGGEIFTRNDIFDILEYAYSKKFLIDIFTNGTLLDGNDYIRLKRIWPRCVNFSLYSYIPEKHDSITRIKGSFEKTLKSIKSSVDIGIPVNIKSPIFSETKDDIEGLVDLANNIGCSVELGTNITPKMDGDISPLNMRIQLDNDKEATDRMISQLIGSEEDGRQKMSKKNKLCGAGDHSLCINPYGEVFPCNMLQICVGDVTEESVFDIWNNSDKLKSWRAVNKKSLRVGCEGCIFAEDCVFCPGEAMMRSGNPLAMYEDACKITKSMNRRERK